MLLGTDGTLREIRTLDIRTGQVKTIHWGLPEPFKGMRLSADRNRLVTFRGWGKLEMGNFAVYTL